jgi:hypothetical protein
MVEKLERNGEVAVLYSPGYGAGWSTWAHDHAEQMLFDPEIAQAILAEDRKKAMKIAERKWPGEYFGGLEQLKVQFVPKGTRFEIREYDGNESLRHLEPADGYVA